MKMQENLCVCINKVLKGPETIQVPGVNPAFRILQAISRGGVKNIPAAS